MASLFFISHDTSFCCFCFCSKRLAAGAEWDLFVDCCHCSSAPKLKCINSYVCIQMNLVGSIWIGFALASPLLVCNCCNIWIETPPNPHCLCEEETGDNTMMTHDSLNLAKREDERWCWEERFHSWIFTSSWLLDGWVRSDMMGSGQLWWEWDDALLLVF